MRVSIIKTDNTVYIDGVPKFVDCSSLPANFHALQWDGESGEVEYTGKPKPLNEDITDLTPYLPFITAWQQDEPAPVTS